LPRSHAVALTIIRHLKLSSGELELHQDRAW
jgi:hypothetical protein